MTESLRAHILSVARLRFIQQGYYGLSMRQIAEEVGVSKAALYYHFSQKEDLLLAILTTALDELEQLLIAVFAAEPTAPGRIRLFVQRVLAQPSEQRALIRLASQEMAHLDQAARQRFESAYHTKFIHPLTRIFTEGIQRRELRPLDPALLTWALLGMMYPYFYPAHAREMPPAELVAAQLAALFLTGVALPASV